MSENASRACRRACHAFTACDTGLPPKTAPRTSAMRTIAATKKRRRLRAHAPPPIGCNAMRGRLFRIEVAAGVSAGTDFVFAQTEKCVGEGWAVPQRGVVPETEMSKRQRELVRRTIVADAVIAKLTPARA